MQDLLIQEHKKDNGWATALLYVVLLILVLLVIFLNLFTLCRVYQGSMLPTLKSEQRVLTCNLGKKERGDIVTFQTKDALLIKRIIAVGGDKVVFAKKHNADEVRLYLNTDGEYRLLKEDYIKEPMRESGFKGYIGKFVTVLEFTEVLDFPADQIDKFAINVPDDYYYVLGDNRNISNDSRSIGAINRSLITGKVVKVLEINSFGEKILRFLYKDFNLTSIQENLIW